MTSLVERYVASMVLSGVGDAMGYKNGGWEFCQSGTVIHKEMEKLGGIAKLSIKKPKWRVSDDTVMHLATGDALVGQGTSADKEALYLRTAAYYKDCMEDMQGRGAGLTCRGCAYALQPQNPKGYQQPFDERGGGCGAAMRAMCIGLRYPREDQLGDLIAYSVESGRMTHHHPTGYLGSLATALFTAYAIQNKPVKEWGAGLMSVLPSAWKYVESQGRYVEENRKSWGYFTDHWNSYLKERNIVDGKSEPKFPAKYGVEERDNFYTSLSFRGWGGASGHDAPMIAYDALLGAGDDWVELCKRGMLHGGDNDSTGVMDGSWFGALYGFRGVPKKNYKNLEYVKRLEEMGAKLYELGHPGKPVQKSELEVYGLGVELQDQEDQQQEGKTQTENRGSGSGEQTETQSSTQQSDEGQSTEQPERQSSTQQNMECQEEKAAQSSTKQGEEQRVEQPDTQ